MKFSSISDDFFNLCSFDQELMQNRDRRPYLIIVKLKYNNHKQDFAIPFRSNISNYIPKEQYFSLPPRSTTQKNKIHGLHYIKMFPIKKEYLEPFYIDRDAYYITIINIINNKQKQIIKEAQEYLEKYENGFRTNYASNIEAIYSAINNTEALKQIATTVTPTDS